MMVRQELRDVVGDPAGRSQANSLSGAKPRSGASNLLLSRPMQPIIEIRDLSKTYATGFTALRTIDLVIERGEIFGLLGPNGAGKTTLISTICGIVTPTSGSVSVDGHDIITDYRAARALIGLVPQEL